MGSISLNKNFKLGIAITALCKATFFVPVATLWATTITTAPTPTGWLTVKIASGSTHFHRSNYALQADQMNSSRLFVAFTLQDNALFREYVGRN
jgi:hypothetical protein